MCGSTSNPAAGLKCVGIWCLLFGIFFGPTSPSSICAIIIGSIALCCSPTPESLRSQTGCLKGTAITGIIASLIEFVLFLLIGVSLLGSYGHSCEVAHATLDAACGEFTRRSLEASAGGWMTSLPELHWPSDEEELPEHMSLKFYNHSMVMHPTIYALLPATFSTTLPELLASQEKAGKAMAAKDTAEAMGRLLTESGSGIAGCDSCMFSNDGACDDGGGAGAEYSACSPCTDMADCGARDASDCDASDCQAPTFYIAPIGDDCAMTRDGDCDDGGPGSEYSMCPCGTDGADCGPRTTQECVAASSAPSGPCMHTYDGWCDDGGPGFSFAMCRCGEDEHDCGPRSEVDCALSGRSFTSADCPATRTQVESTCGMLNLIALLIILIPAVTYALKIVAFVMALCHASALDATRVAPTHPPPLPTHATRAVGMAAATSPAPIQQQVANGVPLAVPVAVPVTTVQAPPVAWAAPQVGVQMTTSPPVA